MSVLPAAEARALLDAMGISVVKLRHLESLDVAQPIESQGALARLPEVFSEPSTEVIIEQLQSAEVEVSPIAERTPDTSTEIDITSALDTGLTPSVHQTIVVCPPFSVISARSQHVLLVSELPEWSGGLLDGRLGALLGDVMQSLGCEREAVDWQYFRWPLPGLADHSQEAAHDALDAWIHRRWGELDGGDSLMLVHLSQLNPVDLVPDAIVLPALDQLLVSPALKQSLWQSLSRHARSA